MIYWRDGGHLGDRGDQVVVWGRVSNLERYVPGLLFSNEYLPSRCILFPEETDSLLSILQVAGWKACHKGLYPTHHILTDPVIVDLLPRPESQCVLIDLARSRWRYIEPYKGGGIHIGGGSVHVRSCLRQGLEPSLEGGVGRLSHSVWLP